MMSEDDGLIPITDERYFHVLLGREELPTAHAVAEFILDGIYFDETDPFFVPEVGERAAPLSTLMVVWNPDRPPVQIELASASERDRCLAEATLLLDVLVDEDASDADEAEQHARSAEARESLGRTEHAVTILVDAETMTEDSWTMVDALEAFLAREYDGLIYAVGDGLFDAGLQPICRRKPK